MDNAPDTNARFQLVIPSSVLEEVKRLASTERRSISNMIVVLLLEAIRARKAQKSKQEGDSLPALLVA